jgi:fumarate hydratase, class II
MSKKETIEIAKKAYKKGRTVREVAREVSGLSEKQLDEIFNLRALTELGIRGKGGE